MWIRRPDAGHCAAVGEALARLHLAGADFPLTPQNALSVDGWRPLFEQAAARADSVQHGLRDDHRRGAGASGNAWPRGLPQGVIHADLFPDNVFFLGDKLSGLIDFYFACTDTLAYDVAICLNAWCFEPDHSYNVTKGRELLTAYAATRPLSAAELDGAAAAGARRGVALPADAAGGLAQRAGRRAGAAEEPARIFPQAALPPDASRACATTASPRGPARDQRPARHHPHRRRLLGQSRTGRLGRDPDLRRARTRS